MSYPLFDVGVEPHWSPPYPAKSWRPRPDSLLQQAGASAESRARAKAGAEATLLELVDAYFSQIARGGVAGKLAEEICWQVWDTPSFRFTLIVREDFVEKTVAAMKEHQTSPKIMMSLCAVLGCVAITGDAKERAHRMGAVDVLLEAVRAHFNHDGLRTWACGCLSNINQHAHAAARFVQMDGIERMLDIIKSTAALEESVGAAAELTNELIGSAARAIRSVIMQAMYMERAIRAGIVKLSIAVLIVRGHKTPVREAMLGFIKDVCTFSEYRPLLLEPSLNAMYTILTTTVKMCVKKVRTPAPHQTEGLIVTHDVGLRYVLTAFGHMSLDEQFCEPLIELGGTELMVQVLRNITNKNSPGVLHAAVTALQNSCFHELTRQDLVFCGAVATLSDFTTEVLNACDHPGSDIVFCCKLLSAGMGGLSLLVLSPDTVAPPSLSTTSTADLATTASISSSRRSGGSVVLPQDFGAPDVTAKSRRSGSPLKKASLRASKSAPSLRKLDVTAAAKSVTFPAEVPESPGGCPMVDKALAVIIRTVILANEREFLEVLRAAVQAAANVCVLPWVQSAFVKEGGVPPVCSLLVHLWDVPRIVNAVCSFISNMARTKSPSFRPVLYDNTDCGKRLIRVAYSNMDRLEVLEHVFAALTNVWLADPGAEQSSVVAAMTIVSSMQSLHTVLRQQQPQARIQIVGYRALRNLACIGDEAWCTEVGKVFLGPVLAVLRLMDDDTDIQIACGTCFAALCRSRANRDAASSRDSMESLVANMRKHLANHPVTLSLMHCIAQLTLSLRDHPEQFTRDCMAAVLKARATHPDSSEVQHLTLSCVNNVAVLDNDLVVWLGRISSAGLPLLLEARRLRLSGAFSSFGPGPLAADLLLGVAKAALPM